MNGIFADAVVIHAYTRAQALRDGGLIDVTETAREPTGTTTTGRPRREAAAADAQEPEPHEGQAPEPNGRAGSRETNATRPEPGPPAAEACTQASERRAKRARSGTDEEPPAHQLTTAPAEAAA